MPLPVGTIVAINWVGSYQQQRYLLTHTYRITETSSTQEPVGDTNSLAFHFTNTDPGTVTYHYRKCLPTNYDIREVAAQAISPQRHVKVGISVVYGGTAGGTAITGNVAATVTLKTQLAGRSQISNKHIGPIPTAGYNNGLIIGTLFSDLGTLGIQLSANQTVPAGATNTIKLAAVIFHKEFGQHDLIYNSVVSDRVGTMRRRTLRVGE